MRDWALLIAFLAFSPTAAVAADVNRSIPYSLEIEGWTVGRASDSCLMSMEYEGKGTTTLTVLHNKGQTSTALIVINYGWSANKDQRYLIEYQFDDYYYSIPSIGVGVGGSQGFMTLTSEKLLDDFGRASSLRLTMDHVLIDALRLKGSARALIEFRACRSLLNLEWEKAKADEERLSYIPEDPFKPATD